MKSDRTSHAPTRPAHPPIDDSIANDLDALREDSSHRLPPLAAIANRITANRGAIMSRVPRNQRNLRIAVVVAVLAVSGLVFATTGSSMFSIFVDTDGKTDDQVEQEVHDQLIDDGVQNPEVEFQRDGDESRLEISGEKGDGEFHVIRQGIDEDGPTVIEVHPPQLDTTREPGMTDDQLRAKIEAQLQALGLDGEVEVDGDHIRVKARKEMQDCGDDPCPPEGEGDGSDD